MLKLFACIALVLSAAPGLRTEGLGFVRELAQHGPIEAVIVTARRSRRDPVLQDCGSIRVVSISWGEPR